VLLLVQISRTPYVEVANIDSDAYQQWAIGIAGGQWWPKGTFYQSPFYAYYLAVLYKLFGVGTWSPRVAQVLLGSLSPVFVYAIGSQLFTRRIGWIAGIALALYGPVMLEEVTLSKTSLLLVTTLAGFVLYLRAGPPARLGGLAWAGFFFGLSVVGVAQWLLAFLALTGWAYVLPDAVPRQRRLLGAAAFFGAGLLTILPVVWWNTAHGGGLVLTSGGAGLNLYTGNNPRATGLPASPRGVRDVPQFEESDALRIAEQAAGRPLLPAEVSRYWSGQARTWITQHPGTWLALLGKKLVVLWNAYEIPDNYHYGFMRRYFLPVLWPLVTFALVSPLALVGLVMPFWRRKDLSALYLACFAYLVTPLIFYVRTRYRLPSVPFLIVFAAVAVERLVRAVEARHWQMVAALTGAFAVAGAVTNHVYCEEAHDGWPSVCLGGDTWYDQEWLKLTEWYERRGDLDRAIAYAERTRECSSPRSPGQNASWIGGLESKQTRALLAAGRRDEATTHFARAESSYRTALGLRYQPGATGAALGTLYAATGRTPQAISAFESGQAAGGIDRAAVLRLGRAYGEVGRCANAQRLLAQMDHERGYAGLSDETRAILAACQPQ
jgi:4-amino-4-deoxy-L-arabinose transferase-like glycosyltransferase